MREPEWGRRDLALVLAQISVEADVGPHGVPMSRATAADAKFEASPMPTHDKAAKALAKAQKAYYDQWPEADRSGDLWSVKEVTD